MKDFSRPLLLSVVTLATFSLLACGKTGFSGNVPQPSTKRAAASKYGTSSDGSSGGTGGTGTNVGTGGTGTNGGTGGTGANGGTGGTGANGGTGGTDTNGTTGPDCSTQQAFYFDGVKINSSTHTGNDSEGQCNTSCHWAPQPPDLKTRVGCATRDCHAPGTVNDSICPPGKCVYYKTACKL